ncbi:Hypothetical predicted protein [Octopus vulgaris]|uniref:Uncharacterized protein n=2 Tax=Octopus TaxID=6643 RepID=A0AA36AGE1_OCTVU|nr:Hypothetical predicted protein [Octopus vulgaris]
MPNIVQVQKTEVLKCKLRHAFLAVQHCASVWQECARQQEVQLKELFNLCEQYQCCYEANVESLELPASLNEVKSKLLYVIVEKIEQKLCAVQATICEFQKSYDKVNQARINAFEQKPDMVYLTESRAMSPTLATMLEWLDDTERQLHLKKYLLDEMKYGDVSILQQLLKSWLLDDTKVINKIQERLLYLEDFMNEP